jgi:hypothetical protein
MFHALSTRHLLAATTSLLLSCGGKSDGGARDAATSDVGDIADVPFCPLNATSCGPECMELTGKAWDAEGKCLEAVATLVGCWSSLKPMLADDICLARTSDGLVIKGKGSNRYDPAVWEPCESSLAQQVVSGTVCGDVEPGGCPASAAACPEGCGAISALPWNAAAACVEVGVTVGCWPLLEPTTADMKCMKRLSDGALFHSTTGSLLNAKPETWGACDVATETTMSAAPSCAK